MHELFLIAHQGPDIDLRIPGDTSVQHGLPGTLHGPGDLPRQHPVVERRLQGGLDFHEPCHVTGRDAVRRQRGRPVAQRDQHLPDAYLGRVTERVHGPCATVGVQDEVARVEAAFQGLLVDQGRGVQVVDVDQAGRGLLQPQAQGVGQPPDHGPGRGLVQRHASGQEAIGAQEPEHDVGVGNRGLGAAAPVAGGAGFGSRAVRAHSQRAGLRVTLGDRAAAARGGAHVQMREPVGVLVDDRLVRHDGLSVHDQPDVEGCAAHVGGYHIAVTVRGGQRGGAGQASSGP